jgi:L-fuconolactonase
MIIDSHCHAWTTWPYDTRVPDPDSRGRIEQLLFEMDRNHVDRAVVICARIDHNPDNNEYITREAARHPDRITAFPDIDSCWSPEYHTPGAADRLRAATDRWPLIGFTHYLGDGKDGWLTSDEGMAFFQVAAERELIASVTGAPTWLADLRQVARAFPTLPILLHHLGMARAADGPDSDSVREVLACADLPNILVKVSGFYYGSELWHDYPWVAQQQVFRRIHDAFGPGRLVWGSDYPVSPWLACTYAQALAVVREHGAAFIPPDRMTDVLGGTLDRLLRTRHP